jgi:hypothetical protein
LKSKVNTLMVYLKARFKRVEASANFTRPESRAPQVAPPRHLAAEPINAPPSALKGDAAAA